MAAVSPTLRGLPAELRIKIFTLVLKHARCRQPLVVRDSVYTESAQLQPPRALALLVVNRATNEDCRPILYDNATVEMSVRSDSELVSSADTCSLGNILQINGCPILRYIRHLDLEIYIVSQHKVSIARAADRVRRLAAALNMGSVLKTLRLVFFVTYDPDSTELDSYPADSRFDTILNAFLSIQCDEVLEASRNSRAASQMGTGMKWKFVRNQVKNFKFGEESFREISVNYWSSRQIEE